MPSVPPNPQPSEPSPASGAFRLVSPDAANTDDVPTIISSRRPHAPADLGDLRGQRLGHFEIIEPIGVGGMAAVLRARDVNLGRFVALKILPPESAIDPEHVTRFRQEARAAALLDHENVARVYFCGEDQGLNFIAFEFVEGKTIRTLLETRGPFPVADAIDLMLQVARGLAHSSTRGVIHRDIKPSNVIVTPEGRAKIVDMGLARRLDARADNLTHSGVTLGTFDYLSPEQALEPRTADVRSDIYSLGCTFYHVLTGQPPVPDGTAAMKLNHHQSVQPQEPRELNPQIPVELVAILARSMAKSPEDRYQKPMDLVIDLESLARMLHEPAGRAVSRHPQPAPRGSRIRFAIIAFASVAAVAGLVLLHELTRPISPSPTEQIFPSLRSPIRNATAIPAPVANDPVPHDAATTDELLSLFKSGASSIRLTGRDYEMPPDGLVFAGRRLTLIAADPFTPAIFHFADGDPVVGDASRPLVRLRGPSSSVTIRGVRFEVGDQTGVSAITANKVERLALDRCTFIGGRNSSVPAMVLESPPPGTSPPQVTLDSTAFLGPADAIGVHGAWSIVATNVSFLNSLAAFTFRESGGPADAIVKLEQCTARLTKGSCFRFEDGARGTIQAGHCLFSGDAGAALVRQVGQSAGEIDYRSLYDRENVPLRNAYHGVACWIDETSGGVAAVAATPEDCQRLKYSFSDSDAAELSRQPFQAGAEADPRDALTPDPTNAELRVDRQGVASLVGAQIGPWGRISGNITAPVQASRTKVVDPSRDINSRLGLYRTLAQALSDARADDTILLKTNEPLALTPIRLDYSARLTIAPFPGYRPVLTLVANSEPPSALFQFRDGALTFRDIQFQLRPRPNDLRPQSVVAVTGSGHCTFSNCIATLEESNDNRVCVVAQPQSTERHNPPKIRFDNCFIRGKGDLLDARSFTGFELEMDNALVAVDGSVVMFSCTAKDSGPGSAIIRLNRVTTCTSEHFLYQRGARNDVRSDGGAPSVRLAATQSLIVAASNKPIFRFEGVENEEELRQVFHWVPGPDARFGNCTIAIAGTARGAEQLIWAIDPARWRIIGFDGGGANPFVRLRFAASNGHRNLGRVHPFEFRPKLVDDSHKGGAAALDVGVVLDRLPRLELENGPKSSSER